jgi:hypothetical protein
MERPINSTQNYEPFRLEELEARVLLSADGLSGAVDDGAVSSLESIGFESAVEVVQDEQTSAAGDSDGDEFFDWSEGVSEDFLTTPEVGDEMVSDSSEEGDVSSDDTDEQVVLSSEMDAEVSLDAAVLILKN